MATSETILAKSRVLQSVNLVTRSRARTFSNFPFFATRVLTRNVTNQVSRSSTGALVSSVFLNRSLCFSVSYCVCSLVFDLTRAGLLFASKRPKQFSKDVITYIHQANNTNSVYRLLASGNLSLSALLWDAPFPGILGPLPTDSSNELTSSSASSSDSSDDFDTCRWFLVDLRTDVSRPLAELLFARPDARWFSFSSISFSSSSSESSAKIIE